MSDRTRTATREATSALAHGVTAVASSGLTSALVAVLALGWMVVGIAWQFDEHWHLWTTTVAALVTLVMVFFIQHTTNQESRAMLVKLDELLRVHEKARGELMSVEDADLATLDRVDREMTEMQGTKERS